MRLAVSSATRAWTPSTTRSSPPSSCIRLWAEATTNKVTTSFYKPSEDGFRQIVRRPSSFPHASRPSKAYGRSHGTEMSAQRRRLSSCQQNSVFYHLPDRKKPDSPTHTFAYDIHSGSIQGYFEYTYLPFWRKLEPN